MKYYRNNKKTGKIEVYDSETGLLVEEKGETDKEVKEEPVVEEEKPITTVDEVVEPVKEIVVVKETTKKSKMVVVTLIVCTVVIVATIIGATLYINRNNNSVTEVATEKKETKKEDSNIKEIWNANKAINSDYVGQLVFESGLINLPVVQGTDNNTYFRKNWETMSHDEEGSIFMDYRNEPDDQNTIIYGHYVYPSYEIDNLGRKKALGDRMFTPLSKLVDETNYKANKYVDLYLENEVIRYEVAVVYYCEMDPENNYDTPVENMYYMITNYDEEYFETYKKTIYEKALYDTGVDIKYDDKLLTLQTCVENHDELLEIVVCKEISREAY